MTETHRVYTLQAGCGLKVSTIKISLLPTDLSKKAMAGLRDPVSWLFFTAGASSRNLAFASFDMFVHPLMKTHGLGRALVKC